MTDFFLSKFKPKCHSVVDENEPKEYTDLYYHSNKCYDFVEEYKTKTHRDDIFDLNSVKHFKNLKKLSLCTRDWDDSFDLTKLQNL